jgi:chromosome segregation ATPase
MSKQDRQGARTPAELEQKYAFGKSMSDLEAATMKNSDQLSRQNQTMTQFMSDSNDKYGTLEAGLYRAEKNISTVKTQVSSLSTRMSAAEKKNKEQDQKVSALIKSASALEQNSSGVDKKMVALEKTVADLTKQLKTAEETLADLVERVTALEST